MDMSENDDLFEMLIANLQNIEGFVIKNNDEEEALLNINNIERVLSYDQSEDDKNLKKMLINVLKH